jgi:hypothetical protein
MKKDQVVKRFLLQSHVRFEPASAGPMLNAVVVEIDDTTGKALSIVRLYQRITFA